VTDTRGIQAESLVVITGVSGSGKSTALNALEDIGFLCVDNLPAPLIDGFVDFLLGLPKGWSESTQQGLSLGHALPEEGRGKRRFALRVDCRGENSWAEVGRAIERLEKAGTQVSLLFFDCQDDVLIRRFRETRRPHPLILAQRSVATIAEALKRERELLADFRLHASRIIDTTQFSPHELRRVLEDLIGHERTLQLVFLSFGFKYGIPHDADLVADVRFLPNPYFVAELKSSTGEDQAVWDYVMASKDSGEFLSRYSSLLEFLIPRYQLEGKRYLTVAVGCTGGRHRSVVMTEALAKRLDVNGVETSVRHRDIARG